MSQIRVLWFTNNACSALELLNPENPRGGWLTSLEKGLASEDEIELHISFYHGKDMDYFKHGNTFFHPLYRGNKKSKLSRLISRIFGSEYNDVKDLEKIRFLVEELDPDIIHIHGTEENFGLILEHTNIPTVISIQGLLNPILEKFFAGIPRQIANKFESYMDKLVLRSAGYKYRTSKAMAEREVQILKNASFLIGRTEWDRVVTRLMSPRSIYFVGQEVLRPTFYTLNWHETPYNGVLKLLTTTGDSIHKGFEVVVKTAILLKQYSGFKFEWQVAGLHEHSHCVRIVKHWLCVDLASINVKLLGNQNESHIAELLAVSDIYCQVSHIENSPNSLCEAMMIGTPSIATSAGGTSTLLEHNKEGIVIQEGDPFMLAGSIIELSRDFKKAQQMSKAAQKKAARRHDKQIIIQNLLKTYKSIINT